MGLPVNLIMLEPSVEMTKMEIKSFSKYMCLYCHFDFLWIFLSHTKVSIVSFLLELV